MLGAVAAEEDGDAVGEGVVVELGDAEEPYGDAEDVAHEDSTTDRLPPQERPAQEVEGRTVDEGDRLSKLVGRHVSSGSSKGGGQPVQRPMEEPAGVTETVET